RRGRLWMLAPPAVPRRFPLCILIQICTGDKSSVSPRLTHMCAYGKEMEHGSLRFQTKRREASLPEGICFLFVSQDHPPPPIPRRSVLLSSLLIPSNAH
uniref:Uncharacterized protein n=1 Tax=Xiphophorus couchianus TaxID=32473 RepID=A0A3B5MLB7_9TELE